MPKKRSKKTENQHHPLVGTWVNGDEYATDVEYIISRHKSDLFEVRALDRYDNEEAEIYDIKWDGEVLAFAAYWNSTGRLSKCRFKAVSQNRVSFTYTYTDNEMLHRKSGPGQRG